MNKALRDYLDHVILDVYRGFDQAHQPDHVLGVIKESLEIAKAYDLNNDMVETIAYYHDIGMLEGRKTHHLTGAKRLFDDPFLKPHFETDEIIVMKEAIEDHRASRETPPRSIYGKIIAEADRDLFADHVIKRTVQFGLHHDPLLSLSEHVNRAYEHIRDKYGPNGYLTLWLETKTNLEQLLILRHLVLDKEKLITMITGWYQRLKKR